MSLLSPNSSRTGSLSASLVERSANLLGRNSTRRGFLARVAVLGSALSVAPVQVPPRHPGPRTWRCAGGAACDEGWTAFCCTITGNECPTGSSSPAGGRPTTRVLRRPRGPVLHRLQLASCGSDWQCHCASGTCDQRRVACNQFRYGQCHQEIRNVTGRWRVG